MKCLFRLSILFAFVYTHYVDANMPRFFHGRPRDGFVKPPDVRDLSRSQMLMLINDPPNEEWFPQRLDHFNPADTRTWKQRYFKAGPASSDTMFVMIGGEGAASEVWMVSGMWTEYAKAHNSVLLQLEHRFYGESHPTEDVSVENLQYLSSEQALSDLANFISTKKTEFGVSKVIVVGGSYSGNLAAWFRLKYPHLADGALAASAPVLAQVNFKGYLEVVSQALNTFKSDNSCNDAVSAATAILNRKLKTAQGRKELKEKFKLCDEIDISVEEDIANLFQSLADNFMGVVQYNNISHTSPNIRKLCGIMTNKKAGDELDRYAQVNDLLSQAECLDFKYSNMVKELKKDDWETKSNYRIWLYQTCTEFGYYQSSDSNAQPFGHEFPIKFSTQLCKDVFGSKFSPGFISRAVNASNINYGARRFTEDRVVFTNGNIDPWHYLGITQALPQTTVIFINGTAHCADMYKEHAQDPPGLNKARAEIAKLIGQWLQ